MIMQEEFAQVSRQLAASQAEVARLRAALEWALIEGGWRLWYYAGTPIPGILETGMVGSPATIRVDLLAADPGQAVKRVRRVEALCKAAKALCHRWPEDVADGIDGDGWEELSDLAYDLRTALATLSKE